MGCCKSKKSSNQHPSLSESSSFCSEDSRGEPGVPGKRRKKRRNGKHVRFEGYDDDLDEPIEEECQPDAISWVLVERMEKVKVVRRLETVQRIARNARASMKSQRGASDVVNARMQLVAKLDDEDASVREAAVDALAKVFPKDEETIKLVIKRLCHVQWYVRESAAKALGRIAGLGHASAVGAVIENLEHPDVRVRETMLRQLPHVAKRGDEAPLRAAIKCLEDEEMAIAQLAVRTVAQLSAFGHAATINALEVLVKKNCKKQVREQAIFTLGKVSPQRDQRVVSLVAQCLGDPEYRVRLAACEVLAQLSLREKGKGDTFVVAAIKPFLDVQDKQVALSAIDALRLACPPAEAKDIIASHPKCKSLAGKHSVDAKWKNDLNDKIAAGRKAM